MRTNKQKENTWIHRNFSISTTAFGVCTRVESIAHVPALWCKVVSGRFYGVNGIWDAIARQVVFAHRSASATLFKGNGIQQAG
jgi:hypothetical protein